MKFLIQYGRIALLPVLVLLTCSVPEARADASLVYEGLPVVQSSSLKQSLPSEKEYGQSYTLTGETGTVGINYAPDPKPDLIVESITWSPESPSKDDNITFIVVVKNQGNKMSLPTGVHFYADGSLKERKRCENLEPGESVTQEFIWIVEQGTHQISMAVDNDRVISESNEDNNELSVTITSLAPDLIVDSIAWSPEEPVEGDNVTFSFTIKNQGDGRAGSSIGTIYIGEYRLGTVSISPIEPGEEYIATIIWDVEPGLSTVKLIIDQDNRLLESDEDNNEKEVSFTSVLPDLIIQKISWSPENLSVGETVTFSITIMNQGLSKSGTTRIHLYVGDVYSTFIPVEPLVADSSKTETLEWVAKPGEHRVKVIIDPYGVILETNESNNEIISDVLTVKAADLIVDSINWSPLESLPGETLTFTVIIRNSGYGDAEYSQVAFLVDDVPIDYTGVSALTSGSAKNATFNWVAEEGAHTIKVVADYQNRISESNESNNEKIAIYPVPPDLTIKNISLSPAEPKEGNTVTFTVTVANEGDTDAESTSISCFIDDVYVTHITGNPIGANSSDNLTFTLNPEYGNYIFKVVVDPLDRLVEANEDNNEMTMVLSVAEKSSEEPPPESNTPDTEKDEVVPKTPGTGTDYEDYGADGANLWFFALLAAGVIIMLSYAFFEYRRRRS